MTMAMSGLAKLAEELGELQQVVGKLLAYPSGDHPDGGPNLWERLADEGADVTAAMTLVSQVNHVDVDRVRRRAAMKLALFQEWHNDPSADD